MSYVFAILVLSFLVFVHELGHFLVAKYFKMPVKAFSIGMGPVIFKKKHKETEYRISLLPIGGYVSIMGEDDKDLPHGFLSQRPYKRFLVLIAGVVFNFVTAILLFTILLNVYGNPVRGVQIQGVVEESVAAKVLNAGDQLLALNGNEVNNDTYLNIPNWVAEDKDKKVTLKVRQGEEVNTLHLPLTKIEGKHIIGITYSPKIMFIKNDPNASNPIVAPFEQFVEGAKTIFSGLEMIVTGQVTMDDIQGPVGIVKTTGDIAESDFALLLFWTALLSINLGIMNLLPIPALDGGQIMFLGAEVLVGKKRWNHKIALYVNAFFMLMLLGLMLFISYYDVMRIFD